jgi:hypothetical protein
MDTPLTPAPAYISIAGCPMCAQIPQKVSADMERGDFKLIPPEVDSLLTVLEMEDDSTPAYCSSLTRLLNCPKCGTYYYYNHYDDDGQHFMDPTCDNITVRRYDAVTTMAFLEGIVAGAENALPRTMGQMTRAFAEGAGAPSTSIGASKQSQTASAASVELKELRGRYDILIDDLTRVIHRPELDWQIKMYATESLCFHFLAAGDWEALSRTLLANPDPVVRVESATLIIGMGTDDSPAIDLVHSPSGMRSCMAKEIARTARMEEMVAVLLELARSTTDAVTMTYDHGYGSSKYWPRSVRSSALYGLVVSAGHGSAVVAAVPALVGMLSANKNVNAEVCWVLREAGKKGAGAQAVKDALDSLEGPLRARILADAEVARVLETCRETLARAGVA